MERIDDEQMGIVRARFETLSPHLDEKGRRLLAAFEARSLGYGGTSRVSEVTGMARSTIGRGLKELDGSVALAGDGRVRREGAGRKRATETQPGLMPALRALVEPATRGDPEQALLWVSKSGRQLAQALKEQGHRVSRTSVVRLLKEMGYTLQSNAKTREGSDHPDRDARFSHINTQVKAFIGAGQPVISVDTRKKELVGNFRNAGRTWRPKGRPEEVNVHDFADKELGKAAPYGVFDVANNVGWVNVGISHDTAAFAVESIRRWWKNLGQATGHCSGRIASTGHGP